MDTHVYVKMVARQHGIILTHDEADYILWNRTPWPLMPVFSPLVTRLLRMEFANYEKFDFWRGIRGLAVRIMDRAMLDARSDGE